MRLRDLSKMLPRFQDPAKIFGDSRFSKYHSPPLICNSNSRNIVSMTLNSLSLKSDQHQISPCNINAL